ncbi:hypothetical protein [Nocardioides astragali]|uniref:Uncharacterized protein n=1 Tax=Nocardioides astragali TaxID=1776736 RepID=A0ABW2N5S9_9ACTN|nr:hypothetical protein [Nocardioides astragali]
MGSLHPYEQALTLLLAFGPFVVLGLVVWLRRHADETASISSEQTSADPLSAEDR